MYKNYYWLNEKSRNFLSKDYINDGKDPIDRVREICLHSEKLLGIKGFADKLEGYVAKGYLSFSSPVWSNFGLERGCAVSCFSSFIDDTIDAILEKQAEVGKMSKLGGGTSAYFGKIRPRGSAISNGGTTSGAVFFMQLFDKVTSIVSQSSVRRGSFAAYLDIDHGDIEEFLQIKGEGNAIQEMSFGVCVSDEWLNSMIDGDQNKRRIWAKVIEKRFESGYPYIFFTDNVNNNKPKVYKDKGMKVHASNLCVAPETLILTKNGHIPIKSLDGKLVEIWNGKQWSFAQCSKTGSNQKLIKVILEDGSSLDCTPYHKFYVDQNDWSHSSDGSKPSPLIETKAIDLNPGDLLHKVTQVLNIIYPVKIVSVQSIQDLGRIDDTYCVNEPLDHKAVFNGILTGNCSEIALPSSPEESFVCVLSSINLLHWDEIIKTDAIETFIYFLDSVNQEFINKTVSMKFMEAAHRFANNHRALGLGALGWHSYLQSKMIPFESMEAKLLNTSIWKFIKEKSDKATIELAKLFGEPEVLKGYGKRNTTLLSIAPNTSSSFILGQISPSIEPLDSNYFVKDLAKGKYTYKNPYLKEVLKKHNKDTSEIWEDMLNKGGSVQHLSFLSENEKNVFKTFGEISQREVIIQAAQRQKFIDQSQSLNLMIHPDTSVKDVNALILEAHRLGVKTLYYSKSTNPALELNRSLMNCKSCEA